LYQLLVHRLQFLDLGVLLPHHHLLMFSLESQLPLVDIDLFLYATLLKQHMVLKYLLMGDYERWLTKSDFAAGTVMRVLLLAPDDVQILCLSHLR
jgi:hypothetical protein